MLPAARVKTPSRSLVAISFALVACRSDMNGSGPSGHPALDIGPDLRGYSGHEFSLTARVNPQGATRESFRWTLSWGDGASDRASLPHPLAAATAAHRHATTGQFPVRLSLLGTGA